MENFEESSYELLNESDIVSLARSGNESALNLLLRKYNTTVLYWVSKFSVSSSEKEDLIQEGLIALFSAIKVYDSASSSFSTFASLCIKRGILSALRHLSQKKHIPSDLISNIDDFQTAGSSDPESCFIDKESFDAFSHKIRLVLSSFEYEVLVRYLRSGSYDDICRDMSVDAKKVNNALQRARKKIKKISSAYC